MYSLILRKPRKGYATRKNERKKNLLNWQRAGDGAILTLNKTNVRVCACAKTRARPLSEPHYSYCIFSDMDNK